MGKGEREGPRRGTNGRRRSIHDIASSLLALHLRPRPHCALASIPELTRLRPALGILAFLLLPSILEDFVQYFRAPGRFSRTGGITTPDRCEWWGVTGARWYGKVLVPIIQYFLAVKRCDDDTIPASASDAILQLRTVAAREGAPYMSRSVTPPS